MPLLETGIDASGAINGSNQFDSAANKIVSASDKVKKSTDDTSKGFLSIRDGINLGFGEAVFSQIENGARIIAEFAARTIKLASDFEETSSKFEVVFKGMETEANEFAMVLERSYNMSIIESRKFLSSVQDLLVPMGMTRQAAGAMSFELVKLAADLGSFNNMPTADVMQNITSALTGEYESMKKFGIILNETTVKQEALNLGLTTNTNNLSAAEKAQAAFSLMVKGSSDAIGDMERTSGSYANQLKGLNAGIETLTTKMGQVLLPYATQFVTVLNNWFKNQQNVNSVISATVSTVQFLYNGFKGLELTLYGFNVIVASVFDAVYQKIVWVLTPLSDLYDSMVQIGAMDSNPLKNLQKITTDYANSAVDGFKRVWSETEKMNLKFEKSKTDLGQVTSATNQLTAAQKNLTGTVSLTNAGIKTGEEGLLGYMSAEQIANAQTKGLTLSMGAFEDKTSETAQTLKGQATPALNENKSVLSSMPGSLENAGSSYESFSNSVDQATSSLNRFNNAGGGGNSSSKIGSADGAAWNLKGGSGFGEGWTSQDFDKYYRSITFVAGGTLGTDWGYSAKARQDLGIDKTYTTNRATTNVYVNGSVSRSDISNIVKEGNRQSSRY